MILVKGTGILLNEPSVIAVNDKGITVAVVSAAKAMLGKAPVIISVVRPLQDGVISDFDRTADMLKAFLETALAVKKIRNFRVVVGVPSGVTEVEKRSFIEACEDAGARQTHLIEEPIAAAIGAGLDIAKPVGQMVVDVGGGTTDIAVISLGGAVISDSIKCAGDKFDDAMIGYIKKKYNMIIGERTAEDIKVNIGSAFPRREDA